MATRVRTGVDRRDANSINYTEKRNGHVYHPKIKKEHALKLVTLENDHSLMQRTWYFYFSSDVERDEWLVAINEAATAFSKSEAGVARFVTRQQHPKQFMPMKSTEEIARHIEAMSQARATASAPPSEEVIDTAGVLGKLEADVGQRGGMAGIQAQIAETQRINDLTLTMATNSQNGIVDFGVQKEWMGLVSKHPEMKVMIMAPGWAQQLMLPGRGGLWIDNVVPVSPASFMKGVEAQHDVVIAINGHTIGNDPGEAVELSGVQRWRLAELGKPCVYTLYNLKTRLFSTVSMDPNPANLPKPPMASGIMSKWIEGAPGNGITPNNEEPVVPHDE